MDPTSEEGIDEELTFLGVLIGTLDPDADDYSAKLADLEAKKAHFERQLETMRSSGQASSANSHGDSTRDQWWQDAMGARPSSHQSSSGASNGFASGSPLGVPFNSVKRQRPQSSYLDTHNQHPSKRHTPEPSNAGTPISSDGSYDFSDRPPHLTDRARAQHQAAEAAARQQHQDALLARQLSSQQQQTPQFAPSSSRPGLQTTLNYNGTYQRPPVAMKSEASSARSARPSGYGAGPYGQPVKTEPGLLGTQQLPQRPRQAPQAMQVVDLTNSDDELEEIAPVNFTPSRRLQPLSSTTYPAPNYSFAPVPTTMQRPTTMQMPGAFPSTNGGDNYVYGHAGMNRGGNNNTVTPWYTGIANGLAEPLRQLNQLVSGSNSSRPVNLDDDDDVIYGGARQFPTTGQYAGNEDLYRDRYDAIAAHDSTKTREEIQQLMENIRPDEEMPAHLRVQTPEAMAIRLHKYQELGLTWLKKCEEGSNQGGILADDMGLGKTIQMLSLMVTRKSEDPRCKTTLIIAPVALMRQWAQEIRSKLKTGRHQLTVFTHHGTRKAKSFQDLRTYDVVLTTYGSIASELKKLERFHLRKAIDQDARPYPKEKCIFLDPDAEWYRVILDEAQYIKNRSTQAHKGACMIRAKYRFCVTGTPMMNNVEELYSLIHFLRIKPYCRWEKFRLDVNQPLKSGSDEIKNRAMQVLQALCKAVMLRRTKSSKFEGQPILVLPERSTEVNHPVFSPDEKAFYDAVEGKTQLAFNRYLKKGTVGTSYSAILVLLLRLRQACCHPHLLKDFGVEAATDLDEDQMIEFARKLEAPVVARIKETGGNFECPICYDVTPNPAIFIPCGHDSCSDCLTRIADPANAMHNGEEATGVRCPNCRGPVDPKRLTDFNSFKKVHMPELLSEEDREKLEDSDDEVEYSEDDGDTESDEEDEEMEDETLGGFIVPDNIDEGGNDDDETNFDKPSKRGAVNAGDEADSDPAKSKGKSKKRAKGKGKGKGKEKAKKVKAKVTMAELKKLSTRNKPAKRAYLRRLRKSWISSAKIEKTMEILREIMTSKENEKILIFSQWTSLLDLLEVPIDDEGFGYRRYDGSMSATMRGDAVDDFRDESKQVRIMLISLKAGNAGLNLNMANQVIILDPFWNPYIEEQAIDRAHRFGQMRPVKVHRLLIQETVEDRIIALQEKKRALISEALDEKQASALSRLGVQELAYLFGVSHDPSARLNYVPRNRR